MNKFFLQALLISLITSLTSCISFKPDQEFYELRTYKIDSAENHKTVMNYIMYSYKPALENMGLERIGVFVNAKDQNDFSIYMVIPFEDIEDYTNRSDKLFSDYSYMNSARNFFDTPIKTPPYTRIESSFFKAFSGMPIMEIPQFAQDKKPRIFEMRIYESHNEEKAMLKRDMFNVDKEIQLMRDLKMGPVFFGECLSGHNAPNLTYFLSAESFEDSQEYWKVFRGHPRWLKMKAIERYKDTVSKIISVFLKPANCSDW